TCGRDAGFYYQGGFFMLKRALLTCTELAMWGLLVVIVAGLSYGQAPNGSALSSNRTRTSETQEAARMPKSFAESILIPRHVLFGNAQRAMARMSPDGKWISFLAPLKQGGDEEGQGVLNVWVAPADDISEAKPVTDDKIRGIRGYSWAYNSRQIIYSQDVGGDENWHIYATDVETRETIDLTPVEGVNGQLMGTSEKFPDT